MYRNWSAISGLGAQNRLLMLALATVDLGSEIGLRLTQGLPEFFSKDEENGAIPLSVLRHECAEYGRRQYGNDSSGDSVLVSYDILQEHNIPYIGFDRTGNNLHDACFPLVPESIKDKKVGDVVSYENKDWVVVENNEDIEELYISPLECINPTT